MGSDVGQVWHCGEYECWHDTKQEAEACEAGRLRRERDEAASKAVRDAFHDAEPYLTNEERESVLGICRGAIARTEG